MADLDKALESGGKAFMPKQMPMESIQTLKVHESRSKPMGLMSAL